MAMLISQRRAFTSINQQEKPMWLKVFLKTLVILGVVTFVVARYVVSLLLLPFWLLIFSFVGAAKGSMKASALALMLEDETDQD